MSWVFWKHDLPSCRNPNTKLLNLRLQTSIHIQNLQQALNCPNFRRSHCSDLQANSKGNSQILTSRATNTILLWVDQFEAITGHWKSFIIFVAACRNISTKQFDKQVPVSMLNSCFSIEQSHGALHSQAPRRPTTQFNFLLVPFRTSAWVPNTKSELQVSQKHQETGETCEVWYTQISAIQLH